MVLAENKSRSGTSKGTNTIQSLERAITILEYLRKGPTSLSELHRELGLHKSTIFGLLQTLVKHNYVHQERKTGHYSLGYRVLALGSAFLENCDLRKAAAPYLKQLVDQHSETVHLVIMDNGQVVYVDKIDSSQSIRMVSRIGSRLPAHCTGVGKAILAFLPEEKVERIIEKHRMPRFTVNTITTWEELKVELDRIREKGVAFDWEEIEEGLCCVAAPIIGYGNYPLGALSVSGPKLRMTEEKMSLIAGTLKEITGEISRQVGNTIKPYSAGEFRPGVFTL